MKTRRMLIRIDPIQARRLFAYLLRIVVRLHSVFLILILIIVLGGICFTLFDGRSFAEGQYLALITALTVGYGDLAPVSWPARIVSGIVGLNGLILTGVIIACVVKALELTFRDGLEDIEEITNPSRSPDSGTDR